MIAPSSEGISTGMPMYRQNWSCEPPRFAEASRHSLRNPAIDGLRKEWREASANLGGSQLQFWRYIGIPVLMPSLLGAIILLFGNAFAAYATAYSLTSGTVNLVPILIGAYYSGNVLNNPHLAQAMAFGMFVVLALMMVIYIPLQRRAARWAK